MDFFVEYAQRYVDAELSPQDYQYSFRGDLDQYGKRRKYELRGIMKKHYLDFFIAAWRKKYDNEIYPFSQILKDYLYEMDVSRWEKEDMEWLAKTEEEKQDVLRRALQLQLEFDL